MEFHWWGKGTPKFRKVSLVSHGSVKKTWEVLGVRWGCVLYFPSLHLKSEFLCFQDDTFATKVVLYLLVCFVCFLFRCCFYSLYHIHDPLLGYCHLEFLFDSCQPHNSLGIIGLRYLKIQSSNMWTVHIYQMPQGRLIQKDPPFLPCHFPYTPKFNIAPQKWWLEDYFPFGMAYFQWLC